MDRYNIKFSHILLATSFLFVLLAIFGAVRNYSPVPFMDMWDSYMYFYFDSKHFSSWLNQHNEHRILISKLFFWLDIKFFSGKSISLIILNFLLLFTMWLSFFLASRKLLYEKWNNEVAIAIACVFLIPIFSWLQYDNMIVGFQSQSILSYLFPLLAFLFLAHMKMSKNYKFFWFGLSIFWAILSIETQANGIFVLPILAIMAFFLNQSMAKLLILIVLSCFDFIFYFHDYSFLRSMGGHSLFYYVQKMPFQVSYYLFYYMGSWLIWPINRVWQCAILGASFIALWLFYVIKWFKNKVKNPIQLALLFIIFYFVITTILTGVTRFYPGAERAPQVSRYMTGILTAWSALLAIIIFNFKDKNFLKKLHVIILGSLFFLLVPQINALTGYKKRVESQEMLAALALQLGIRDVEVVKKIYPWESIYQTADKVKEGYFSIFSNPYIYRAGIAMNKLSSSLSLYQCDAHINSIIELHSKPDIFRTQGFVSAGKKNNLPKQVFFVDASQHIVGVGLISHKLKSYNLGKNKLFLVNFSGYWKGDKKNISIKCFS